jgi:3-oxoacyl-[acyl-carrier-protein] synthase II
MADTDSVANLQVAITGLGATSAFGRGTQPLLDGVTSGAPAFGQVTRFETDRCRARAAAVMPGSPVLAAELARVIDEACAAAALSAEQRTAAALLLALHSDPAAARDRAAAVATGDVAAEVAMRAGLSAPRRIYTSACVAASTAVVDGATRLMSGRANVVVVAAGFLVDADTFTVFDAGRVLARDGQVRPFSSGRQGLLLGDGVAAVVLERADAACRRGVPVLATLAGWGRAGDAYHVCQPRPDGAGLARATAAALARARVDRAEIGYINANGAGTSYSDASEAAALRRALGDRAAKVPTSSTKSVHGHALEASALLELVGTVLALRAGRLPVNAGFLGPDDDCQLDLVLEPDRQASSRYALSLNAAFGGANTALVLETA